MVIVPQGFHPTGLRRGIASCSARGGLSLFFHFRYAFAMPKWAKILLAAIGALAAALGAFFGAM